MNRGCPSDWATSVIHYAVVLLDLFCVHEPVAVVQLFEFLLETVDTCHLNPIACTGDDDAKTDKDGKRGSTDNRAEETVDTESRCQYPEQKHNPPATETYLFEVKRFDGNTYALKQDDKSKNKRQRCGKCNGVNKEIHSHQYLQQCGQEEQSALRQNEVQLAPSGKLTAACDKEHQSEQPCYAEQCRTGIDKADNAQGNECDACDTHPDFSTCFHNDDDICIKLL